MNNLTLKKCMSVILASALVLSVSGCSGKKTDSVKAIQESGVIKVAIVNTNSAYTSMEGSIPSGMEPDLINTIAGALGASVEFMEVTKSEALNAVASETVDIAVGCINRYDLDSEYSYSTPYGKGYFYVVTQKGDFAQSAKALAYSAIGVNSNLSQNAVNELYVGDGITVHEYRNVEDAVKDVKDGRIRAYICYEDEAEKALLDDSVQVQNLFNATPEEYVIVSGKNDTELINGINVLIQQFLEKEQ